MWVEIGGNRYTFAYNHDTGAIEIRDKSYKGPVLYSITDKTSFKSVLAIFKTLRR